MLYFSLKGGKLYRILPKTFFLQTEEGITSFDIFKKKRNSVKCMVPQVHTELPPPTFLIMLLHNLGVS